MKKFAHLALAAALSLAFVVSAFAQNVNGPITTYKLPDGGSYTEIKLPDGSTQTITNFVSRKGFLEPGTATVTVNNCGKDGCIVANGTSAREQSFVGDATGAAINAAGFAVGVINAAVPKFNSTVNTTAKVGDGSPVGSNNPSTNYLGSFNTRDSNNGNSNFNLNDYNNSFNNVNSGNDSNNGNSYDYGGDGGKG